MIQTDQDDRPQLVHKLNFSHIRTPPFLGRLAILLKLKKGNQRLIQGDDVMFVLYPLRDQGSNNMTVTSLYLTGQPAIEVDPRLKAAEILARHLHNGTRPSDSNEKPRDGIHSPIKRVPVHCISIEGWVPIESITKWSDGLRARFPLGTENIICGTYYDKTYRSCSTIFDSLGNMISREVDILLYGHLVGSVVLFD
ncbi:unnamed protein product [Rhizoctonia solani]|uniref:Uncharacterized protein n=1 Tax=Rhizoctonia solani TaxID=456999 RepID=A0A8H3B3S9_9AGAM|nr:unnamed protein product [Rhizoctonia solani]